MSEDQAQSVGIFTTDRALVVRSWDQWMARATGLLAPEVVGRTIDEIYPELVGRGLLGKLQRVAAGQGVEVLAPAFHQYLIPCKPRNPASRFDRMRQHVTISPLRVADGIAGVEIMIQDVTARLDSEQEIARQLASADEGVRFRAAESLISRNAAPSLLVDALADGSWRVRRAAAEGMAKSSGPEAIATLIEAVRERHEDPGMLNSALTALTLSEDDDVIFAVASLLDGPDANVRIYAALALGLLRDSRAVPALIPRLDDPDMNVRFHTLEALGRIGDATAAEAVARVAVSRDFFLSFAALEALALLDDRTVVPQLLPLLDDPMLLPAVAESLGALATEEAVMPLTAAIAATNSPVGTIARALKAIHDRLESELGEGALVADIARHTAVPETTRALIAALPSANDDELVGLATVLGWLPGGGIERVLAPLLAREAAREAAADALSRRGTDAAQAIMEIAASGDDPLRRMAATVLGRIGDVVAVPTLLSMLDEDPDVVIAAAGALAAIGDRRAFEPLLKLIDDEDSSVRQAAVSSLNSIGHPAMAEAIQLRLANPSPRVREAAARIAGYFGYADCLGQMIERCGDGDESVRRAAVESLASYDDPRGWTAIRRALLTDTAHGVRAAAARAMGSASAPEDGAALIVACADKNLWVRYYAIRSLALRRIADASVVARLRESATGDPATPVRISAIKALGELRDTQAATVLERMVADPEADIAVAAIEAFGRFDRATAAPILIRALANRDSRRVIAALDALAELQASAAVQIIHEIAVGASDRAVRSAAVNALARIGSAESVNALIDLAGYRPLRADAVAALGSTSPDQVLLLEPGLSHADEQVRCAVVDALSRMKVTAASRLIGRMLEDRSPAVRRSATRALSRG